MTRLRSKWVKDIDDMHFVYGVKNWIEDSCPSTRKALLELRLSMLKEEYTETLTAYMKGDPEEVIDGLVDLCVIAIGTLDILGVDADKAWNEVLKANLNKKVGVKPSRPNPLGLPDLIKPEGWVGPNHKNNHGDVKEFL